MSDHIRRALSFSSTQVAPMLCLTLINVLALQGTPRPVWLWVVALGVYPAIAVLANLMLRD